MLTMSPAPGTRLLRHVGDRVRITLTATGEGQAYLRTTLGRARRLREETVASLGGAGEFAGAAWRDIPMRREGRGWVIDLPVTEVGYFRAKPYLRDAHHRQVWPDGDDLGISVHPDAYRTANTIYCAFPRMFGGSKTQAATRNAVVDEQMAVLDRHGYTVIPPSGTLRDLTRELPHITGRLGCTILHLLPVSPTPTTYARFGRFGSPYAQQDLTAIDPALVEFDKRTTAVDQFRELTAAAHARGCRVFLDIVINHTGWGSTLMNEHPEWFKREADGRFHSPGAWGTTWEDLVELDHHEVDLWEEIARSLLTWCGRGVDGFRCDAGYMVPLPAWQYIIARVRQLHPDTVFLLEGLGGSWEATEALLTEGGMQWAYSELFQNYDSGQLHGYLGYLFGHPGKPGPGASKGIFVHYSETHDNLRLAARGAAWSRFRNRLCALASTNGAFGFTAGVEWLASEKLEVHQSRGMAWGASPNLVGDLADLNRLLAEDPVFFDGTELVPLTTGDDPGWAMLRRHDGRTVLVAANPDAERAITLDLAGADLPAGAVELTGLPLTLRPRAGGGVVLDLPPLTCVAVGVPVDAGTGTTYRRDRAVAAWAYQCLARVLDVEHIGPADWRALAAWVHGDPARFLASLTRLDAEAAASDLLAALEQACVAGGATCTRGRPPVIRWTTVDRRRIVPVPPDHWVLVLDDQPFRLSVRQATGSPLRITSVPVAGGHAAAIPPQDPGEVAVELVHAGGEPLTGRLRSLPATPRGDLHPANDGIALLTNGRGGMVRLGVDLGSIASKYDCLLGANLHPTAPSDRHVLAKRIRAWVDADGFIVPLDRRNLIEFIPGPPAQWRFVASAGDGRTVALTLTVDMVPGRNAVVLRWQRPAGPAPWGTPLPVDARVSLTVRVDLEDRSFHSETIASPEAEAHFVQATRPLPGGFRFQPAVDRGLTVTVEPGTYHAGAEWSRGIPHPVEASRGMAGAGDAWSPGWFAVPLKPGDEAVLVATAEDLAAREVEDLPATRERLNAAAQDAANLAGHDDFGRALAVAAQAYLVQRDAGKTVIAGYPWFLDWGRDTFICARGLLAAGQVTAVRDLVLTFARFEEGGTLPNLLNGDHATNRDTSDAPLWFAVVCEELAAVHAGLWSTTVTGGRTVKQVVAGIAAGYLAGTANGIRVDPASALVYSPPHFTWMDTNYPAGTPREGYPVEIQVLWIRLLRLLARLRAPTTGESWKVLADRAYEHLITRFWNEEAGYLADCLHGPAGTPAEHARQDTALRPNQLFAVSLGLVTGPRAQRIVTACERWLLVPGAIRSLAPLPVAYPLEIRGRDGHLLNDPRNPYWGRYEGDEDTRRKPAYHNGTAWTWPFPTFCEALALAWDREPAAVAAAQAYLGSMEGLLHGGCVGQIPELTDGDAPHTQRGCDAQAWGVLEALRVWKALGSSPAT